MPDRGINNAIGDGRDLSRFSGTGAALLQASHSGQSLVDGNRHEFLGSRPLKDALDFSSPLIDDVSTQPRFDHFALDRLQGQRAKSLGRLPAVEGLDRSQGVANVLKLPRWLAVLLIMKLGMRPIAGEHFIDRTIAFVGSRRPAANHSPTSRSYSSLLALVPCGPR
jgi:hypothetical protein